jgi:hypothetical protein
MPTLAARPTALGKTYRSTSPVSCSEVWSALKETLGDPDHYEVIKPGNVF